MNKILLVNDITCLGKVALNVSIPLVATTGNPFDILPTVLLSSHTAYPHYHKVDLTNEMMNILNHFKILNNTHQTVLTGYFYNHQQIIKFIDLLDTKKTLIVDPIMGDNSKLYSGMDNNYIIALQKLCQHADLIIPNLTEACLLCNIDYPTIVTNDFVEKVILKLQTTYNHFIITGVIIQNTIYVYYYNGNLTQKFSIERISDNFFGTGDIFSTLITVAIHNDISVEKMIVFAMQFIVNCIQDTVKYQHNKKEGIVVSHQLQQLYNFIKEQHENKHN